MRHSLCAELDNLLRKYKYREALDLAVAGEDPSVAVAVFADYVDRNCLDAALLGRTDTSVATILTFVSDYISVPHFDAVLCDVFTRLLKLYSATLHQSGKNLLSLFFFCSFLFVSLAG